MITRRFVVTGRVQGVGFRWSACRVAERLGVAGWCRNLPDGRVEAVATANDETLTAFESWLGSGPPGARVERVERAEIESILFTGFKIRR